MGKLPFGTEWKGRGNTYTYYISPKLFMDYTGCSLEQIKKAFELPTPLYIDCSGLSTKRTQILHDRLKRCFAKRLSPANPRAKGTTNRRGVSSTNTA